MGLRTAVLVLGFGTLIHAAPVLRLVGAAIGPVPVTPGAAGATQTVEAYNIGDGSLSLRASASVPWITASIGNPRNCITTTNSPQCTPVVIALNTGSLSNGMFTGIVTVEDPNAVDAPQTITVTVRVGPIDLYVAPGIPRDTYIATSSGVTTRTATDSGGNWLTVSLDGTGSFRFSYPYRVRLTADGSLAQGTYSGSVTTSGSNTAADNLTVPVTMRVTNQPIAEASPAQISVRLAQGAGTQTSGVVVSNAGGGILTGLTTAAEGGAWLTASVSSRTVLVTVDPGTLAPGTYTGSVAIQSNAANGTIQLPVNLEIVAKGAPFIKFQGVVDNGTFGAEDPGTPGDVMVVLGEQLSFAPLTVGKAPPLATEVGGASVLVNGRPAPMYYSSYGQLAFQMPVDTPPGRALVQVRRDGLTSNTVSVEVAPRAPKLLLIGGTSYGAIHNAADTSIPMPAGAIPGVLTHPAKAGDTLIIYAIGLGPTSPSVPSGEPAPGQPLAELITKPTVSFGGSIAGVLVQPFFAGLSPGYAGLYQINVTIPENVPKGTINLIISFPDSASNVVQIVVQ